MIDPARVAAGRADPARADPARSDPAYVSPATFADAHGVAARLRPADVAELRALGWARPEDALFESCRASEVVYALRRRGAGPEGAVAIFGVGALPDAPDIGAPWLLGGAGLETVERCFARRSRPWIERLQIGRRALVNMVDARNVAAIRWLRWCGFVFVRALPVGPEGRPFLEFIRIQDVRTGLDFGRGSVGGPIDLI